MDGMQREVEELADQAAGLLHTSKRRRILIALAGIPGSGKTTTAKYVAELLMSCGIRTGVCAMDGYHYPRSRLDAMTDPEEARRRRGAPWTFDAKAAVGLVRDMRHAIDEDRIVDQAVPTFDHAVKDPVEGGLMLVATTQVIILEGLYLLLAQPHWAEISSLVDLCWFVDVDASVARERLARRHLQAGIVLSLEDGLLRADTNDLPNGQEILTHLQAPHKRILSIPIPGESSPSWKVRESSPR